MSVLKDVYDWLEAAGQSPSENKVDLAINLVKEELQELENAWASGSRGDFLDAVIDLYWVVTNCAYFAGEPIEKVQNYLTKVSISNWSKFCKTEAEAVKTCKAYLWGKHPDKLGEVIDCYYEQHGKWWIVKRKDGKILKSLNYITVKDL